MENLSELFVEKIVAGGAGLAFHEGKAVFVPFSIAGERVRARVSEGGRDWLRADLVEVLEASPDRVEPVCPHYGLCGGCNLQHMSYSRQIATKSAIVGEAFRRVAGVDPGEIPIEASSPYGYRNRVQVHMNPEGKLGFMIRDSARILPVNSCPVADPAIGRWLESQARNAHTRRELMPFTGGADRFLVYGIGGEIFLEGRDREPSVSVAGEEIRFPLKGFFQSNLGMLPVLVGDAAAEGVKPLDPEGSPEGAPGGGRAADLYCGVGLFGRFLSGRYERIVCVDSDARSVEYARKNLPKGSGEFYAMPVESWVRGSRAGGKFDLIVADPPRTGMDSEVIAWLGAVDASELRYISCDPATLARDSAALLSSGWRLESVKAYDLYPQTGHIECLARFFRTRAGPG